MVDVVLELDVIRYFLEEALRRARPLATASELPVVKSFVGEAHSALSGLLCSLSHTEAALKRKENETEPPKLTERYPVKQGLLHPEKQYHCHTVTGE